ncbi:hypothetical protein AB1L88_01920 [Tautonia sp. JC769]|uniref:hypothetical protein n=1 Tax=Tautonia sp. JC769 TaxID=3232135 RepID=UPI003457FE10
MMSDPPDDRIGPDYGPAVSAGVALCLALLGAIAAASMTAIALSATFEVFPFLPRAFERYRLVEACSRFAAEATAPMILLLSYRSARGRTPWPRRLSLLGIMKGIALLGVIASRFLVHFRPWMA